MSITFETNYATQADFDAFADDAPLVNLSNTNAQRVLAALGFPEPGYCGSLEPVDLIARCSMLIEFPSVEDAGFPTLETGGPGTGGARIIEVGTRAGYYTEVAHRLIAVAEHAQALGLTVTYC